jgi:hypothetical protein
MNNQFDELTKSLAQSVTRRAALKKFGVGLAGMALACFGLANKAAAARGDGCFKKCMRDCISLGGDPLVCPSGCSLKCYGFH